MFFRLKHHNDVRHGVWWHRPQLCRRWLWWKRGRLLPVSRIFTCIGQTQVCVCGVCVFKHRFVCVRVCVFKHLGFTECSCCLEFSIYSRICHDYGLMIFDWRMTDGYFLPYTSNHIHHEFLLIYRTKMSRQKPSPDK